MRYIATLLGITLLCLNSPALRAETLQDVEKKLTELKDKHKSVELKMKTKLDFSSEGMSMKTESEGTGLYALKGDKWLYRTESKDSTVRVMAGQEQKITSKTQGVFDGEYMYSFTDSSEGGKQAMKMKPPVVQTKESKMFDDKIGDFKLLPDEKIDGKSCWVIEMRSKPLKDASPEVQAQMMETRTLMYYRKSDGVGVKTVTYDKSGKPTTTMTVTDVKFDVAVKPDEFKFVAPEGVTVTDMTNLGQASEPPPVKGEEKESSGAQASPEPKEEDKPKEQPKQEEQPKPKKKGIGGLLNKLK